MRKISQYTPVYAAFIAGKMSKLLSGIRAGLAEVYNQLRRQFTIGLYGQFCSVFL